MNIYRRFVRALRRAFTPTPERVLRDFEKKIAALGKVADLENDTAREAIERRQQLRSEIAATHAAEDAAYARATRATNLRNNLENLINA